VTKEDLPTSSPPFPPVAPSLPPSLPPSPTCEAAVVVAILLSGRPVQVDDAKETQFRGPAQGPREGGREEGREGGREGGRAYLSR
jgi:hypothetical protein